MADRSDKPKKPKQGWRKIIFRFRPEQLDEANLLKDYDARSQLLGRPDHDYLRRLALIGHLFTTRLEASGLSGLALSTNESNNTGKEPASASTNESQQNGDGDTGQVRTPAPVAQVEPGEVVGTAIRQMAGVFGGAGKSEQT